MTRAQCLKQVFGIDIVTCPACGGSVRIIACIEDPEVIEKILTHLGTKAAEPEATRQPPCRSATPARCCSSSPSTAATVLASNKGFEEWGTVRGDEVMAAALIDRVPHPCHLVNIRGNSYRLRDHATWRPAPTASPAPTPLGQALPQTQGGSRPVTAATQASRCAIFTRHNCAIFGRR